MRQPVTQRAAVTVRAVPQHLRHTYSTYDTHHRRLAQSVQPDNSTAVYRTAGNSTNCTACNCKKQYQEISNVATAVTSRAQCTSSNCTREDAGRVGGMSPCLSLSSLPCCGLSVFCRCCCAHSACGLRRCGLLRSRNSHST